MVGSVREKKATEHTKHSSPDVRIIGEGVEETCDRAPIACVPCSLPRVPLAAGGHKRKQVSCLDALFKQFLRPRSGLVLLMCTAHSSIMLPTKDALVANEPYPPVCSPLVWRVDLVVRTQRVILLRGHAQPVPALLKSKSESSGQLSSHVLIYP